MQNKSQEIDAPAEPQPYKGKKRGRKPGIPSQISKRLEKALRAVLIDGLTISNACLIAGINESTYYLAAKKPHVKQAMSNIISSRNVEDAALSRRVLAKLAENASSDQVKYQAALALADRLGGLPKDETKQAVNAGPMHSIVIVPYGQTAPQLIQDQMTIDQKRIENQHVIDVASEPVGGLTAMDGGRDDGREPGAGG